MQDYFGLLNLGIKILGNGRNLLFILLHMAKPKLMKKGPSVPVKLIFVEMGKLLVNVDKLICSLYDDEDIFLSRNVEDRVINVGDIKSLYL